MELNFGEDGDFEFLEIGESSFICVAGGVGNLFLSINVVITALRFNKMLLVHEQYKCHLVVL